VAVAVLTCLAAAASAGPPLKVSFNGTEFFHRWSQNGQNEFTPAGDENLDAWKSMVTINVHDWAQNGDQLAQLANQVLGRYQASGRILRTNSKPKTKQHEAEHFAAVSFGGATALESAFARILLFEKRGVIVVYSHRIYGAKAGDQMSAWLAKNGPAVEKALMAWDDLPSLATLRALPQAVDKPTLTVPAQKPVSGVVVLSGREAALVKLKALGYPKPLDPDAFVGAAAAGQEDVVRAFLAAGVSADSPNRLGDRAFLMAIRGSYMDLAAEILKAGADPKLGDAATGLTPLIELASYCDETKLFAAVLKAGADVKAQTRGGLTALKNANGHGCTVFARLLKRAGAVR
jgi:hypothetical protein